jgi:hypothetical protein
MKNFLLAFFLLISTSSFSQVSFLKAGGLTGISFPASDERYIGSVSFPPSLGLNLSGEWPWGRKVAFVLNLEAVRAVAHVYDDYRHVIRKETNLSFSLIPEVRYYFLKNPDLKASYQGMFLQCGINLFSYYRFSSDGSYFLAKATGFESPIAESELIMPLGFGVKYPLNANGGMELNFTADLAQIVRNDRWQTIQIGVKYYWLKEKKKTWLDEKEEELKPNEKPLVYPVYWKAGAAVNATYMVGKSNSGKHAIYPVFPSINASYEKAWGKRSAWVLNLEFLSRSMEFHYDYSTKPYDYKINVAQVSFIPEYRLYFGKNYLQPVSDKGFFLQAGFELFHYMMWDDSQQQDNGFSLYPNGLQGWFERNVPIGFGFKLPLKNNHGLEMNLNTNLMQITHIGNDQTFSLGLKYFWRRVSR